MLKKHFILIAIIACILLFIVSAAVYPGGSQKDIHSVGYDWANNYISNLFGEKAVNGAESASLYWAAPAMLCLSLAFALFFIDFSKKIPARGAANITRYFGLAAMVCTFLAVTPLHDLMITIGSTLALVSIFYITVFVFKSKLHLFKLLCVICMLLMYVSLYIYYSGNLREILPVMQKTVLIVTITWVLVLQYFTVKEDFQQQS